MYNYHYEGIFKCAKDDCAYQAKYRQAVVNHYRRNHLPMPDRFETVPRFVCSLEICGKSFRNEEGLIRHQNVMHQPTIVPNLPPPMMLPLTMTSSSQPRIVSLQQFEEASGHIEPQIEFNRYLERHSHCYQIVAVNCFVEECQIAFPNCEELDAHLESLHNILPYRCFLCNISFSVQ